MENKNNNDSAWRLLESIIDDAEKQENMKEAVKKLINKKEKAYPFSMLLKEPMGGVKYLKAIELAKYINLFKDSIIPDNPEDPDEGKDDIDKWREEEMTEIISCGVCSLFADKEMMLKAAESMPTTYDYVVDEFWKYKNGEIYGFDWIGGSAMALLKEAMIVIGEWVDEGKVNK